MATSKSLLDHNKLYIQTVVLTMKKTTANNGSDLYTDWKDMFIDILSH